LQDYDKAVETYQAGLERDPDNQELKEGLLRCVQAINKVRCVCVCVCALPVSKAPRSPH
jgi:hypothetical protein